MHLRAQLVLESVEFLKGPLGKLHHHIVARRHVLVETAILPVRQFIEGESACQHGGDRAMGKPVALEARAEEREVRGLISMTTMRPVLGSCAHCTLVPPITPTLSTMRYESSCNFC